MKNIDPAQRVRPQICTLNEHASFLLVEAAKLNADLVFRDNEPVTVIERLDEIENHTKVLRKMLEEIQDVLNLERDLHEEER